jgi:hypothetical protein
MLNRGGGGTSFGNIFTSQTPVSVFFSADCAVSKAGMSIHKVAKAINVFFIICRRL